jgi:hypothetical protein
VPWPVRRGEAGNAATVALPALAVKHKKQPRNAVYLLRSRTFKDVQGTVQGTTAQYH